jgi:hypothetical protein
VERLARRAVANGWWLGALALIVYAALASPHLVDGDNAEFATLGAIGGRAHPSGYPLYVLWLRAWSWLPGTPAHAGALATAILGALAVVVVHAACRAWGARPLAATITAAMFAAAPVIVRYASEAEVFALDNLVVALVVWLAAAAGPLRGHHRAAALGVIAGLGLANHLTCVLVAPIGILGVIRAARESRSSAYAVALAGLVIGLVPYAYLFFADGPASWGRMDTAGDLIAMITRRDYGVTSLMTGGADVAWTASLGALGATLARSWLWLPALAGVAMLGVRALRPVGEPRAGWLCLAASFVLAGPVLMLRFNIDPHGVGHDICERFHMLPAVLLAIPIAAALEIGSARITRETAAIALCVPGVLALWLLDLPRLAAIHTPAVELGVRNTLRSLPPFAIAVVTGDDQCFGARYLQLARGERPDVAVVCAGLLPVRTYRDAWAARGLSLAPSTGPHLTQALLATGRPIVVDPTLTAAVAAAANYPFGVLVRLVPPGAAMPAPADVAAINRDLFRAFALDYPIPGLDDGYATVAHHRYAASWAAIAQRLDRAGDRDGARDAFALTQQLKPQ